MKKIVIDTDIGFDPDDLFTLLLVFNSPEVDIALIISADEIGYKRANFIKTVLKMCHREDVPLVCGARLNNNYFVVESLKETNSKFDDNYIESVKRVIDGNDDVVYLGIGGFTNLANFYKKYPNYKDKFAVFMMGGAINYDRGKDWVEHNVKVDQASAQFIVNNPPKNISFVMAQTTFQPEYEVNRNHPIFKKLKQSPQPAHILLVKHMELFNQKVFSWPKMHDPLTFATAIGKNFVTMHRSSVKMDPDGRIRLDLSGKEINWSDPKSKKNEFMKFLENRLFK